MAIVCYKLLQALGENPEGSQINLDDEVGAKLVEAGIAEEMTAEDMNGEDMDGEEETEETEAEQPMVGNAVSDRVKVEVEKGEKAAAERLARAMAKVRPEPQHTMSVPAQPKEALYKNNGAYIKDIIKAEIYGDRKAKSKVMAHQQEIAKTYDKMGFILEKSPLGINETTSAQGGYLVNPQFSPDVYAIEHGQVNLQELCDPIEAKSNTYNQRFVNESSLANGSIFGGLNMVATAEGASFTSSLPAWSNLSFTLNKEAVFVYYTSEILEDASYPIEAELNEYTNKAFVYGINTQIVQGSTLEGLLNSPALVTITSSSNDTAFHTTPSTNLTYADLANMWASVYPDSQASPRGVWLFHPSLLNPLSQMTYTFNGTTPAWSINYDAQDGLRGSGPLSPYSIFGKKAIPSWACSAPGTTGDILYVDFATVLHYRRPFRVEVSKDFQFLTDQVCVRYVWRGDIKTRFRNKVTGVNGSQNFSAIVTRSTVGS